MKEERAAFVRRTGKCMIIIRLLHMDVEIAFILI